MNWTKLVAAFSALFEQYVKKYLVSFILKTIGVSGGIWTSIVSFVLTKIFIFEKKKLEESARLADQEKIDKKIKEKHDEQLESNAPESDLIESETDILNGGRK